MPKLIEKAWDRVRSETDHAGAIRIDPGHPANFFAAQDSAARLGLLLVLDNPPPSPPRLEAVDVVVGEREDGRWGLSIWLTAGILTAPFTQLCEDLIESSRAVPADQVGRFVIGRLHRWQELLESAGSGMSLSKLRGLIGELLMLRDGLGAFGPTEAVRGWVGPFHAPQDFALPDLWIEVKATFPTARAVRISSADQLAAPGKLILAVYTLASLLPQDSGITAAGLVTEIEVRLGTNNLDDLLVDFGKRLSAVGYERAANYTTLPFRQAAVHFYDVGPEFPRITPSDLPLGVGEVAYDLSLGALQPFETESPV